MKATTLVSAITAFGLISAVSAIKLPNDLAEAICGDLAVMNVTDLPEGVDADAARTCKEHPEGVNVIETTPGKRDCWFGNSLGCSVGGYCYKSCAQAFSRHWCWTAHNNEFWGLGWVQERQRL